MAVEDQGQPAFLMKCDTVEKTCEHMEVSDTDKDASEENLGGEAIEETDAVEDFDEVKLGDATQVYARNILVQSYRTSVVKRKKIQVTSKSIKVLHRKFTMFGRLFDGEKVEKLNVGV